MSGFAGIVRIAATGTAAEEDTRRVEKMAAAIAFRGPDSQERWSQPDAHFCFALLRTGPAAQSTSQPCSIDGNVWLLGAVRLDGRKDVVLRLQQAGEEARDDATDEELVLRVFRLLGESGVAALDGDFSIALWDATTKSLLCFRDLTGSRPFFYLAGEEVLSFSNTLDALRAAPGFSGALDEKFIGDYLLASWCLDPERTAFREIRRLPPGHLLKFSKDGFSIRQVAQLPMEEPLRYKRDDDYIENYRELLHRAVNDRLPGNSSVVFLSGGLDSSTVAAVAAQILGKSGGASGLHAHTVDYRPLFDDQEGEAARGVAKHLNISFELLHGGDCAPFSGWDAAGFPLPEPRHEPFQALHVEHYKRASSQARVALSGDGGDDILLGQAWPYLRYLFRKGQFAAAAGTFAKYLWNSGDLPTLGLGIRSRIKRRFGQGPDGEAYPDWLSLDCEKKLNLRERWHELQAKPVSLHPTHPWPYAMLTGPFWPNVLEGEDAAWSGTPMETRAPLLDRRLLRFLLRLPALPWCMNKALVRRAMKDVLSKETVERPKSPLAQDPLELHVSQRKWSPLPLGELSPMLNGFIDVSRLANCITESSGEALYLNLRPVSLDRWLKSVEMRRGIQ